MREVLLFPFFSSGNPCSERQSPLPKVTQLDSGRTKTNQVLLNPDPGFFPSLLWHPFPSSSQLPMEPPDNPRPCSVPHLSRTLSTKSSPSESGSKDPRAGLPRGPHPTKLGVRLCMNVHFVGIHWISKEAVIPILWSSHLVSQMGKQ